MIYGSGCFHLKPDHIVLILIYVSGKSERGLEPSRVGVQKLPLQVCHLPHTLICAEKCLALRLAVGKVSDYVCPLWKLYLFREYLSPTSGNRHRIEHLLRRSFSLWFSRASSHRSGPPILSEVFSSENLSTNGRVLNAAISPDGKNVAYTNGLGNDRQSVWLKQLDTSNTVQIIPPSDEFYNDLTFSPDGNFLYFVRGPKPQDPEVQNTIYRISIFGGIATKIVEEAQGGTERFARRSPDIVCPMQSPRRRLVFLVDGRCRPRRE